MDDLSLRTKVIEQGGRRFDIRVFRYGGGLLEAVPFENETMADISYPDGLVGQPLYQVTIPHDATLTPAVLDSLIETAEADIRRRVALSV